MKKVPRLKNMYQQEVRGILLKEFAIKNNMAAPLIEKIVINTGIGAALKNKELIEVFSKDLAEITGQKPAIRKAKISVASFGIRRGMPVGLKVTLRGNRMYDFLDNLISITLPRLRDFRGIPLKSFDKSGNYTFALDEQTVFPVLDITKSVKPFGMEITIVTSVKNEKISKRLLELMGMPFEKKIDRK